MYASSLLSFMAIIWIILYISLPTVMFNQKYTYKNISISQNVKNNIYEKNYLKKITNNLSDNFLYDENITINIYITNSKFLYAIFVPGGIVNNWHSYASAMWGSNIFVQKANFITNKSFRPENKKENLDAILAHELIHMYQFNKYGRLYMLLKTPTWVTEGYAVYTTQKLYIDTAKEVLKDFIQNYPNMQSKHISAEYKLWGLMVQHALEKMNKSVDDLHLGKVEYDEVLQSLLKEYNITKEGK